MVQAVFSILFYLYFLVFTLVFFVFFSLVFVLTVAFDRQRKVLHVLSRFWSWGYFRMVPSWKIKLEGVENLDPHRPYVVIVNHRSMLDIMLMYALPLYFKWVSKREVYSWPVFGWVLWMHGDIAIERGTAKAIRKMVREGVQWLRMGSSVIIFPEGSRGKEDKIGRFREGAFMLAKEAGVQILPCVSEGTGTAFIGWKVNFRNKFRIRILPPVEVEEVMATDVKTLAQKMQQVMASEYESMKRQEKK